MRKQKPLFFCIFEINEKLIYYLKSIKIIKNRSDVGAGTRGSDMGIDAMEIAAINKKNSFFSEFDSEDVKTENESIYNKVNISRK